MVAVRGGRGGACGASEAWALALGGKGGGRATDGAAAGGLRRGKGQMLGRLTRRAHPHRAQVVGAGRRGGEVHARRAAPRAVDCAEWRRCGAEPQADPQTSGAPRAPRSARRCFGAVVRQHTPYKLGQQQQLLQQLQLPTLHADCGASVHAAFLDYALGHPVGASYLRVSVSELPRTPAGALATPSLVELLERDASNATATVLLLHLREGERLPPLAEWGEQARRHARALEATARRRWRAQR